MEYVKLDLTQADENLITKYHALKEYLKEKEKEDKIKFLYRGDKITNIERRLNSGDSDLDHEELFRRAFYFGDKSKHFTLSQLSNNGQNFFKNLNDVSANTLEYIYIKIFEFLNDNSNKDIVDKCISNEFKYFFNGDNKEIFIQKIVNRKWPKEKLLIRDYFLFFLHVTGVSIHDHSMLVSTTTNRKIASTFCSCGNTNLKPIIHYFISSPYYKKAIAPWMINQHKDVVNKYSLPTYNPVGLYRDEQEVSIKGALLPHCMLGIELLDENKFIINHHIRNISLKDLEKISKNGFDINQENFESDIFTTAYLRWAEVDEDWEINEYSIIH